jgi:hypothetical protein
MTNRGTGNDSDLHIILRNGTHFKIGEHSLRLDTMPR